MFSLVIFTVAGIFLSLFHTPEQREIPDYTNSTKGKIEPQHVDMYMLWLESLISVLQWIELLY